MTIGKIVKSTSLVIDIENGVSETGTVIYKKKSLANVRTNVDPTKAYAVADAISAVLQSKTGNYYLKENSIMLPES